MNCRDVRVEGLRLQNSAMWMQHYLACERVTVRGIRVWNFCNANNDGIDLDGCKDCLVSQCVFESDDDGITLKSTLDRPTEAITISDCIVRSHCNAIKLGTESNGGFKDITIANCVVTSPRETNVTYGHGRGLSGISLELVDGGQLERVAIANITIQGVTVPLFLRLGDRARPFKKDMPAPAHRLAQGRRDQQHRCHGCRQNRLLDHGSARASDRERPVKQPHVYLRGWRRPRTGRRWKCRNFPRNTRSAPCSASCRLTGSTPVMSTGCASPTCGLRTAQPDLRHAMVLDDVEDLAIDGLDAGFSAGAAPVLSLVQARGAIIRGCQPHAEGGTFLKLAGDATRKVQPLIANDLDGVGQPVEIAPNVPASVLSLKRERGAAFPSTINDGHQNGHQGCWKSLGIVGDCCALFA